MFDGHLSFQIFWKWFDMQILMLCKDILGKFNQLISNSDSIIHTTCMYRFIEKEIAWCSGMTLDVKVRWAGLISSSAIY